MAQSCMVSPAQDLDDLVQFNSGVDLQKEDVLQVSRIQKRAEELFEEYSSSQHCRSESVVSQQKIQTQLLRQQWAEQQEAEAVAEVNSSLDKNLKFVEAHANLKVNSRGGNGQVHKVCGIKFEEWQSIPYLKAYTYLRRNQLATDEGKIMYKMDKDEELQPVIDDQSSFRDKDVGQFRVVYTHKTRVVRKILQEYGRSLSCEKALRKALGIDDIQLKEIMQSIERTDANRIPLMSELPSKKSILDYQMLQGQHLCRICYTSTCLVHAEAQVATPPLQAPFKLVEATVACGPLCYLNSDLQNIQQSGNSNSNGNIQSGTEDRGVMMELLEQQQLLHTEEGNFVNGQTKRKQLQNGFSNGYQGQYQKRACREESKDSSSTEEQIQVIDQVSNGSQFFSDQWQQWQQWSVIEEESLKTALNSNEELTPCQIADMIISKPCFQVNKRVRTFPVNHKLREIPKRSSRRKKGSKSPCMKFRDDIQQQGGKLNQYTPCACEGQCSQLKCMCVTSGNFCDKFCACAKQGCENAWGGCTCMGDCWSARCPCFAVGRECDPDLCTNCCPFVHNDSSKITCRNMGLRKGEHKHVIIGISDVQGWGAFINEPVEAGDLIGEYTGDIISNQEAERRGTVYDTINLSYLFDLNKKQVVDAFNKGNKLRFANHSSKPNCQVKNMLVNGDHRLGIFAGKQLKKGEELLYDYKYSCETAPQWAKFGREKCKEKEDVNKFQNKQNKKKRNSAKRSPSNNPLKEYQQTHIPPDLALQ